jgi:beta-galactosidase GanA
VNQKVDVHQIADFARIRLDHIGDHVPVHQRTVGGGKAGHGSSRDNGENEDGFQDTRKGEGLKDQIEGDGEEQADRCQEGKIVQRAARRLRASSRWSRAIPTHCI